MNKNNVPLNKLLKHEWNELDIACKAVLIIGVFLLIQLICAIFIPNFHSQPTINAIFQTSLSSIFGYILGMNIPHEKTTPETGSNSETQESTPETSNQATPSETSAQNITREIFNQEIEPQIENQEIDNASHLTRGVSNEDTETDSKTEDPVLNTEIPLLKGTSIRVLFAAGVCLTCLTALTVITLTNQNNYTDGIIQVDYLISTTIGFLISNTSHTH